jgi:hypothetical protein
VRDLARHVHVAAPHRDTTWLDNPAPTHHMHAVPHSQARRTPLHQAVRHLACDGASKASCQPRQPRQQPCARHALAAQGLQVEGDPAAGGSAVQGQQSVMLNELSTQIT